MLQGLFVLPEEGTELFLFRLYLLVHLGQEILCFSSLVGWECFRETSTPSPIIQEFVVPFFVLLQILPEVEIGPVVLVGVVFFPEVSVDLVGSVVVGVFPEGFEESLVFKVFRCCPDPGRYP